MHQNSEDTFETNQHKKIRQSEFNLTSFVGTIFSFSSIHACLLFTFFLHWEMAALNK